MQPWSSSPDPDGELDGDPATGACVDEADEPVHAAPKSASVTNEPTAGFRRSLANAVDDMVMCGRPLMVVRLSSFNSRETAIAYVTPSASEGVGSLVRRSSDF
jgi:hypothetical protein